VASTRHCHVYVRDCRRGFGLHDSELHTITASSLISTIHKSPQHPIRLFKPTVSSPAVLLQRLLTLENLQLHAPKSTMNVGSLTTASFPHRLQYRIDTSQSYVTTDGESVSLSWNKAPTWGLRPDLYYCLTVAGLLVWGALSDERTGLPFAIATGPRQCSHFRVLVP
jgi:hypothetical protein